MKTFVSMSLGLFVISAFALGCGNSNTNKNDSTDVHSEDDGHNHSHDHSPKHGGHLVEIGRNHEYHAEIVDDHKTESVTVYMMDSHMEPLTIKQVSISLVLTTGNDTRTFELMASQPGASDEFSSNDKELMEMFEGEDVKGKIRVTIDGKPQSGTFDHHGHGHEKGDSHAGHDH